MRNSAFIQHLDIASVLKTELNGVKSKLSEEKRKNSEQQQYIQDLKSKLNHLESVKSERDQCKQEIENIRKQKEESAPLIDVQEYEQQIQKLQHSLEEEKKCVKLVHELFALRCSEFSDEKQSLENKKQALEKEKADLCSKLCFVSSLLRDESDNGCFVFVECPPDVTYSRTEHKTFCDSLDGCKCNTNKCYYGDPCLCNLHTPGCPVNTSLDEYGVCQPCDPGTAKNDTGCGPCRSVLQKLHSLPGNVTAMIHKRRPLMPTMETVTSNVTLLE
ncbi:unnamed protein product [Mytilus edulis]|uniref:Uncharacterized protein n=1 Tax=Mytilus edulis TaxID=6550 RepID=A0A8S3UTZ0_MYTED|nr:unnamed protein product [Mytilus edulis]